MIVLLPTVAAVVAYLARRRARVAVELVRIGMYLGQRRVGCTCPVPSRR